MLSHDTVDRGGRCTAVAFGMLSWRYCQVLPTVSHYYFCLNYHRFVGILPHNQNGLWIYPSEHLRSYSNLVQTVNFSLGGGLVGMDSNLHSVTAAGVCMFLLLNFNSLFGIEENLLYCCI